MPKLYVPRPPIGLGSSFDGIFNDAVTECGVTSFGAYEMMHPDSTQKAGIRKIGVPADFNEGDRNSAPYQAFQRLRPLVAKAGDYHSVVQVILEHPDLIDPILRSPTDRAAYAGAIQRFGEIQAETKTGDWDSFGKKDTGAFYVERARLRKVDERGWTALQAPMPNAVLEFREFAETMEFDQNGKPVAGFVPYFASSKDGDSIFTLCTLYSELGRMHPADVGKGDSGKCIIHRDRIYDNSVAGGDKVQQLTLIAADLGVGHERVIRIDDRFDRKEAAALRTEGFPVVIMEGGYVFPWELDEARAENVAVLPRNGFAHALAQYSQDRGL